jgi:hypothetical protein
MLFSAASNRFMLRQEAGAETVSVFYQRPGVRGPIEAQAPSRLGYVLGMMAHEPQTFSRNATVGLGMSFNQIVRVVAAMDQQRAVSAPLVLQESRLLQLIEQSRQSDQPLDRPERDEGAAPPETADTPLGDLDLAVPSDVPADPSPAATDSAAPEVR